MNKSHVPRPDPADPHAAQPLLTAGPSLDQAQAALIFLHGRGATAQNILSLYDDLAVPGLCALAPQAAENTWYPHSFLAPIESNQPHLDSALRRLDTIANDLIARGLPTHRLALLQHMTIVHP